LLFVNLLERMSVIALAAYIFSQSVLFKRIIRYEIKAFDKLIMIIFFSLLSILGTYMGINVEPGAIANIRPIGAIAAGYLGGPVIGMIVGLIAGTQRYFMGGFTALSCGLSTIFEGLIGGIAKKLQRMEPSM
jgi:two-component system LytT family sensor kinase